MRTQRLAVYTSREYVHSNSCALKKANFHDEGYTQQRVASNASRVYYAACDGAMLSHALLTSLLSPTTPSQTANVCSSTVARYVIMAEPPKTGKVRLQDYEARPWLTYRATCR